MQARVRAAGFGYYVEGLRRSQPRFPLVMCQALLERWNDCGHTFVFSFGELTVTPADFSAITGLDFTGEHPPLDTRYRTRDLGRSLARDLLGVDPDTAPNHLGFLAYKEIKDFWVGEIQHRRREWARAVKAFQASGNHGDPPPACPQYSTGERDRAARAFIFYILSSQLLVNSQNKGDPAVLVCLRDLTAVRQYEWASLSLAHLYHGLDVWVRGSLDSNWIFSRLLEVNTTQTTY